MAIDRYGGHYGSRTTEEIELDQAEYRNHGRPTGPFNPRYGGHPVYGGGHYGGMGFDRYGHYGYSPEYYPEIPRRQGRYDDIHIGGHGGLGGRNWGQGNYPPGLFPALERLMPGSSRPTFGRIDFEKGRPEDFYRYDLRKDEQFYDYDLTRIDKGHGFAEDMFKSSIREPLKASLIQAVAAPVAQTLGGVLSGLVGGIAGMFRGGGGGQPYDTYARQDVRRPFDTYMSPPGWNERGGPSLADTFHGADTRRYQMSPPAYGQNNNMMKYMSDMADAFRRELAGTPITVTGPGMYG